jgi:recombination protein RecA
MIMAKKKPPVKATNKVESIDVIRKSIEKKYGDVIRTMADKPLIIDTISTRSIGLDSALGRGGVALGRHYEFYGENSSGKTTLAMSIIAEAQSRGMTALFVDAEHSADRGLFKSMGVDIDKLLVIDAYTGEKNLMVAETLIKNGGIDLLVVDSVTALIPEVMADKNLDQDSMALLARLMSKALLRLVPLAAQTNTCVIWVNQTRMKIGGYGNPETTTGGTSLPFYATGRVRISGIGAKANRIADDRGAIIGHKTFFEVVKNKLSEPFKKSEADLIYGVGYDLEGEIIGIATDLGLLEKSASWYKYNGKNIGQGEKGVREFFLANPEVYSTIKDEVVIILGIDPFYKAQRERDKKVKKAKK